ncbi:hypothetical protein COW94_01945 [Candidatus Peregrinibacteria bacterium CG22_combo_CG10-13_8_21_14_all_44_10]|nr:MAG: hypothetical protein AUK45_02475 [Candidatus Peregrinibacteria bacterium CG2_30_44_17]PIP66408.1 MAG: hypothetical protein COW94_01945 [Candidatus Peregrinibacteria bacterium CG22_combo_CG10-13_8_21_14_all_44_10]PIS03828.1 MAG: hypothetical protein COT83_03900 [Candidatus Peregrinibacteria bacterium CG10_big_fil_rev_8_21_14_0_10_44_7]PIX79631.1 MAG: hypothetical protein COZ35_03195 [Candidatus Peregrinibacteria bacterium CG_4_10_14_3_um_filter_44_21]
MHKKKIFIAGAVIISALVGATIYLLPSTDSLQGRMSLDSTPSKTSSVVTNTPVAPSKGSSVKSSLSTLLGATGSSAIMDELLDEADALTADFATLKDNYYWEFINRDFEAETYQDFEDSAAFLAETLDGFLSIESRFNDFFDSYYSIDPSAELESKVTEAVAYTESTAGYTLEDIYARMLPSNISYLEHYDIDAYGDLELTDMSVTVGADGDLHFMITVSNNEDASASATRPMAAGDIYLEGDYWVTGAGSSYFGMDITDNVEIEAGNSRVITGTLDFSDRTEEIYNAYLEGGILSFDVDIYINYTHTYQEYDSENNNESRQFSAL